MLAKRNGRHAQRVALAVLGLVMSLSLEAGAAFAPACEGPQDQPDDVYTWLAGYASSYFPLDVKTCEGLTKKAVAACHKAVSDAQKCHANLLKNLQKTGKTICGATSQNQVDCSATFATVGAQEEALANTTQAAHERCDGEFAGAYYDLCLDPRP